MNSDMVTGQVSISVDPKKLVDFNPVEPSKVITYIPDEPQGVRVLYETMYKKGNLKGELRFYYTGTMKEAVDAVKSYLEKKNLKHLHTMPFIVDLSSHASLEDQTRMMV